MKIYNGKWKGLAGLLFALVLMASLMRAMPVAAQQPVLEYSDVLLSGGFQAGHFREVWDLTACDLTLKATVDMTGLVDDFGGSTAHAWSQFGLRSVGYGDFNPGGAGVWLATDYDWAANTFDPDPPGAPTLDMDDKLLLQKAVAHGEGDYNLPSPPPVPGNNHRFWFDRDGVDQWQAEHPLAVDGGTYNTGGTYDVVLKLHADSATAGTAYMSINGLDQGFEVDGNWQTMELSPAGMTFTGDMTQMQVFYGIYGYGATHEVAFKDIEVMGCQNLAALDVQKYNDLNGNGEKDDDEPGLEDWEITLYNDQDEVVASGSTDEDGWVSFDELIPGTYTVCETPKNGWANSDPGTVPPCKEITLAGGGTGVIPGDDEVTLTDDGSEYLIEFLGVTDNGDGTFTWEYRVTEEAGKSLSHWILGLCVEDQAVVDWDPDATDPGIEDVEIVDDDPTTGVDGIKWDLENNYDNTGGEEDDVRVFSFTLDGDYAVGETEVGAKTGSGDEGVTGWIAGPHCGSGGPAQEPVRFGNYRTPSPILECVQDHDDGTYTAFFGYENPNEFVVTVPLGDKNKLTPGGYDGVQPTEFGLPDVVPGRPGRTGFYPDGPFAFTLDFNGGEEVVWTLNSRTSTASDNPAQRCPAVEAVKPILECVLAETDGSLTAYFGYENLNNYVVSIPYGSNNKLTPGSYDGIQPSVFGVPRVVPGRPGRTGFYPDGPFAFTVNFTPDEEIVWSLDGRASTASDNPVQRCSVELDVVKFYDWDQDGEWDSNEPGLKDWTITVYEDETQQEVVASATTDVDGKVSFTLPSASYYVCETLEPGWLNSTAMCQSVIVGADNDPLLFGNYELGSITIIKQTVPDAPWRDFNFSGDLGSFTLVGSRNGTDDSQTFGGLTQGAYSITEDAAGAAWDLTDITCTPEGAATVDLANRTVTVNLNQPDADVTCVFKNQNRPDMRVLKYLDYDGDGAQDEGESGLAGWAMALFRKTGSDPDTYTPFKKGSWWDNSSNTFKKLTDADGLVKWWNFPLGETYLVCEVPQADWVNTDPGADAIAYTYNDVDLICQEVTITTEDYGTTKDLHFGNYKLGQITIIKEAHPAAGWLDWAFTGSGSIGDFVLDNDTSNDDQLDRATFAVEMGEYSIQETTQRGNWDLTALSCDTGAGSGDLGTATVDVVIDESGEEVTCTFVNERRGQVRVIKYEDLNGNGERDEGEPELPGWQVWLYASPSGNGDDWVLKHIHNDHFTPHSFNGLLPGLYLICEEDRAGWENTDPGETVVEYEGKLCQTVEVEYADMLKMQFGNAAKGSLTIIKEATPEGKEGFTFGGDLDAFTLVDDGSAANQATFTDLTPGVYEVTEAVTGKWSLLSVVCQIDGVEAAYEPLLDDNDVLVGVDVTVGSGQDVVCTFTNEKPDAVELTEVEAMAEGGAVTMRWRTLSEMETVGFNVMRSTTTEGLFEQVNGGLIVARGEGLGGASYEFVDQAVEAGVTYYYYVQEVLATGGVVDYPEWTVSSTVGGAKLGGVTYTVYLPLVQRK